MKTLSKISRYLLSSIILFSISTSLISLSVWLDMRIHARHIVYVSFIVILIFILKRDFKNIWPIIIGEVAMILAFALGKFPRVAYELRDAFYLPIKIANFKVLLIVLIILTSIIVCYDFLKNKNAKNIN